MWAFRTGLVQVVLLLLASAGIAHAGVLEVSPVMLELQAGQRVVTLTVTNRDEGTTGVQIRGFNWSQTVDQDPLVPTDALVFSPTIFRLAKNETQIVRIMLRQREAGDEKAFRLLVDEIPENNDTSMVKFAMRLSIPLFSEAITNGTPDILWRVEQSGPATLRLVAINKGQRRQRVTNLSMTMPDGMAVPLSDLPTPYVLVGSERRWDIAVPEGHPISRNKQLSLTAASDIGRINVAIPFAAQN